MATNSDDSTDDRTVVMGNRGAREQPGDVIGRYRLMKVIGEGGMGLVWEAEQQEPIVRRVALKIIKLGMDTGEVVARFEQERQALALMDHPAIAKVLDAGATETGRPFFVMELVPGEPLTAYCDGHHLDIKARLELFIEICEAVQHAHQKGIIHRDLKPSNILVSEGDGGRALPKVIDFGIAKATGPAISHHQALTQIAQVIGTPAYMSPEQAGLGPADIDTRSDIYSLGVVLYELLTGRPPFDTKKLIHAGMEEMLRIIREQTPPRPSTRLNALPEKERTSLAEQRQGTAARITTAVRGDLDWIVMKALEKDRRRRYETVGAFAADLRRHLQHQPVQARPPGAGYLISRFVRRHKVGFAAGTAVALALVAGLMAATWGFFKAERERKTADAERDKAQRARGTAESVINAMLYDLRDKLQHIGKVELLDDVSREAEKYFEDMPPEDVTPQVLREKSAMLLNRGSVFMAQGKLPEARAACTASRNIMERLTVLEPGNTNWRQHYATCLSRLADVAKAAGDLNEARALAAQALSISTELAAADPDSISLADDVAMGHNQTGDLAEDGGAVTAAREAFTNALTIRDRLAQRDPSNPALQRSLATSHQRLGHLARETADLKSASESFGKALVILEKLARADPENAPAQIDLATGYQDAGDAAQAAGQWEEAGALFAKNLAISKRLADSDPDNAEWQRGLSVIYERISSLAKAGGDLEAARTAMDKVLTIRERLAAIDPFRPAWQADLASARLNSAQIEVRRESLEAAAAEAGKALTLMERVVRKGPANMEWGLEHSTAWIVSGDIARARGDYAQARTAYAEALKVREEMTRLDPVNASWQNCLAEAHERIGGMEMLTGNVPAARAAYEKAHAICEDLARRDPSNVEAQRDLLVSQASLGNVAKSEGNLPLQRKISEEMLAIATRLAQNEPDNADRQEDWAVSCHRMANLEKAGGDEAKAKEYSKKAAEIYRTMKAKGMALDTAQEIYLLKDSLEGK